MHQRHRSLLSGHAGDEQDGNVHVELLRCAHLRRSRGLFEWGCVLFSRIGGRTCGCVLREPSPMHGPLTRDLSPADRLSRLAEVRSARPHTGVAFGLRGDNLLDSCLPGVRPVADWRNTLSLTERQLDNIGEGRQLEATDQSGDNRGTSASTVACSRAPSPVLRAERATAWPTSSPSVPTVASSCRTRAPNARAQVRRKTAACPTPQELPRTARWRQQEPIR